MTGIRPRREEPSLISRDETPGSAPATASVDCGGVPPSETTRKSTLNARVKTFILVLLALGLAAFLAARPLFLLQGSDFPHFYCAARMLADGHGRQLYDADLQRQCQARHAGRIGTLYTHPPFEAAVYLAVAWLPLRYAYLLWTLLTMAALAASAILLANEGPASGRWRVLFLASLTFVPTVVCLLQGQDSLLLLLLVVLAFTALRKQRSFAAGCWLGLGLFKFQLVLPLILVLVLTQPGIRRIGLAKGFGLTTLALAGLSIALSGWSVLTLYPVFLLHFHDQPFAGFAPQAMANLRGLTYFFLHRNQSAWAIVSLSILSAAALIATLASWKFAGMASSRNVPNPQGAFDLAFSNTVLFAVLVSYHLNPHDLSLVLLPVFLLLQRTLTHERLRSIGWATVGSLAILFLPPLHLWALRADVYDLVGIPVLLLFLMVAVTSFTTPATSPEKATTVRG
jgi:hypothetical protein